MAKLLALYLDVSSFSWFVLGAPMRQREEEGHFPFRKRLVELFSSSFSSWRVFSCSSWVNLRDWSRNGYCNPKKAKISER